MSRAKHLHVRAEQQLDRYVRTVETLAEEAERRTKALKKKKGVERWYSVDPVGTAPGHLYPKVAVVYHEVRTQR